MGKKVLIIKHTPLKLFIQCMPAFAAIRKFHSEDEVYILTEKSLVGICKRSKLFNKVWLDAKPEWFQFIGVKDLAKRLRNAKFDIIYDLQNDTRSKFYFRLMGFEKPKWNSSITEWCSHPYKVEDPNLHYQDIISNQLRVAGIKETPQIDISFLANEEADELPENFAMVCAGGDRAKLGHKWDPIKYAEIIDILHEKHGITSVLVGDNRDDALINSYLAGCCTKAKPINFSGRTTINGIVSVAKKARFCLGNETSASHIAAFSGKRTIMLCSRFSIPELIAPRVNNLAVVEEPALENVTVERVLRAIEEFGLVDSKSNSTQPFRQIAE